MNTMDALKFSFLDGTLLLTRSELPQINDPNDILVKVSFAGICGTDLHILAGEYPCRKSTEISLGHEISGVIVEVGQDVIHFEEGDHVAIDPNSGCKRCAFCHAGKPHYCKLGCTTNTIGIYVDGGWAQYLVCPEEQVYKLNPPITLEQAVLAEPISCMVHGWELISPITVGAKILLMGGGVAGALWACTLHLQGHRDVMISEPIQSRLDQLRKLNTGFKMITPEQLRKNAYDDPGSYAFDVVIDCSGSPPAIEQGISLLNFGGKYCQYGVAPPNSRIQINPFDVFWKEMKILGSKINPYCFKKALSLIEAMGNRYLNYKVLGIKTFQLSQYNEAIETLKQGKILKAVFKIN